MKKTPTIIIIVLMGIICSCHQHVSGQVPDAVKAAFKSQYPGENDPDWQEDDMGNFESHFKIDGKAYRADYNPDGSWIETERSIDQKDLPKAIRQRIEKDYGDAEITEVEKVEHHSKGTFYDVEFKQKGKNHDVEFKTNGDKLN